MSRTGPVLKPGEALWLEIEDGVRVAVVDCPYCKGTHRHVVPLDVLPNAPLVRQAKCNARRGDVRIVLPDLEGPVVSA